MLQTKTLPKHALALLKELSPMLAKDGFYLAGGTALALRMGHRVSVDLDFFSSSDFNPDRLLLSLQSHHETNDPPIHVFQKTMGSLCVEMKNTKVELFHYPYPQLKPVERIEGISLASLRDNGVMKLSALVNRGSKKDFFDMAQLLEVDSLAHWLSYYQEKFPHSDTFMLAKSLVWFDDAEHEPTPRMLNHHTWEDVKSILSKAVMSLHEQR